MLPLLCLELDGVVHHLMKPRLSSGPCAVPTLIHLYLLAFVAFSLGKYVTKETRDFFFV